MLFVANNDFEKLAQKAQKTKKFYCPDFFEIMLEINR